MLADTLAVGLPLAAGILLLVLAWRRWSHQDRTAARARSEEALDRAELFVLQGAWQACADLAWPVLRAEGRVKPAAAHVARAHLLVAECEAACERREAAIQHLELAIGARAAVREVAEVDRLRAWERYFKAGLGSAPGDPADWPTADDVLDEAVRETAADPTRAIRLARLAVWRAEAEMREGSWPRARVRFEQAVRLGESVPVDALPGRIGAAREREELLGALARARASAAAGEIAAVLASLGRRDEALVWLDRAVTACEGAQLPPGRIALARARIVRAMHEPADPVLGFEPRRRKLVAARDGVSGVDWPAARALAARADIQLGMLAAQEGDAAAASARFTAAHDRLAGLDLPGVAELVAEAHLLLGHVLEDHGDLDEARASYRRALDAGQGDADPDARRLAAVAGCHLHRLLHHADRADEARALLEPLEALAPTLLPGARPLVAAMVARCRGQQLSRDGDRESADRALAGAMALVENASGPEALDLARQISTERGHLALTNEQPAVAAAHFRRALEAVGGTRPEPVEQAERAEIRLRLAHALMAEDRPAEARPELARAFEAGRDSGRPNGRAVAAAAALGLGDDPDAPLAERRAWYESAARFGRLSGTERGRAVVQAVSERLRELAE